MRVKPFVSFSLVAAVLLSLILATVVISSDRNEIYANDIEFWRENYRQAKYVPIGPKGVDELRSGKYQRKVEGKIFDFRKGDIEAYWVIGSLLGEKGHVTVEITTTRGTESNYEFVVVNRRRGFFDHNTTKYAWPVIRAEDGRIDHLLLIKRKMGSGYWYNPSESVETKVTFTYHP